jgi:hypothetical protein
MCTYCIDFEARRNAAIDKITLSSLSRLAVSTGVMDVTLMSGELFTTRQLRFKGSE